MGNTERLRNYVQIGAAVLQNSYFFKGLKFCPTPSLNCYACPLAVTACPMGSLQNLILKGYLPLAVTGFFVSLGAAVGRASCGWACPFGYVQELLGKLGRKKVRVSNEYGWLRYVILAVTALALPFILKSPIFCKLCPAGTLEARIPLALLDEEIREIIGPLFWLKVGLLVAAVWAAVKIKRPFCRFVCPLGAIYSPFNRISALRMEVHGKCVRCDACKEICPVDMSIYEGPNSGACIRCMKCTGCSAVGVSFLGKEIIKAGREGRIGRAAYDRQR